MKFRVTMKDPDTFDDALTMAVADSMADIEHLEDNEKEALGEARRENFQNQVGHWFKYGEYLTVELDTETGTAVVVETP